MRWWCPQPSILYYTTRWFRPNFTMAPSVKKPLPTPHFVPFIFHFSGGDASNPILDLGWPPLTLLQISGRRLMSRTHWSGPTLPDFSLLAPFPQPLPHPLHIITLAIDSTLLKLQRNIDSNPKSWHWSVGRIFIANCQLTEPFKGLRAEGKRTIVF